jgi:hypothetical protein
MANMKIINGGRRELEYRLLRAIFTPGANITAEALKQRLASRGTGQLRAVDAAPSRGALPPSPQPLDDQT